MQRVATRIERVTVSSSAARVRRIGAVSVGDAPREVRIDGLPMGLRDDALRLSAVGPMVAVDARVIYAAQPAEGAPLPSADPAALDLAREALAVAEAERARLQRALEALAALAPGARPAEPREPPPPWRGVLDARSAVAALRTERERALRGALVDAEQAVAKARLAAARAEDDAARASDAARTQVVRKAVVATLRPVGGGGDGTLVLEYVVAGARWAPTYVARLAHDGGRARAQVEVRAVVAQRTGEDWSGVELTLSTGDARVWTELPELASLRIGRRQPAPRRAGWRPPPKGGAALYADWDRSFAGAVGAPPSPPAPPPPAPPPDDPAPEERAVDAAPPGAAFDVAPPSPLPAAMVFAPPPPAAGPVAPRGGRAAMVAVPSAALPPPQAKRQARRDTDAGVEGGGPVPPPASGELAAPAELLAYGALRLRPPEDPARGQLVRASRRELRDPGDELPWLDLASLPEARDAAPGVGLREPPPGTRPGWNDRYDYAFAVDGLVEVPADGGWHGLVLERRAAEVSLRHVAVPRESSDVFRLATLTNPLDAPLLPGPMDVYDGATFLLTTDVGFTPPRGELEVGLGVDPRVKAARNARFREETTGMLRGSLRLEHEVEVDVENLGGQPIALEVRDRLPVPEASQADDVEVEVDAVSPAWEPWTPEPASAGERRLRGGHRWVLELPAGGKRRLSLRYHVKIAGKHELVGGNRRES